MSEIGLIGKKIGMTREFYKSGQSVPVTVVKMEKARVIQVIQKDKRGYEAVQLGYGKIKTSKLSKAMKGFYTKKNTEPKKILKEFKVKNIENYKEGNELGLEIFNEIKFVDVKSKTIGKGFAGAMKRHNFGGLRASHGVSISHRSHGSTGQCQDPGKVFKGKKMAGHMGASTVTTQNLEIIKTDSENGYIFVKGSVPGSKGGWVILNDAKKIPLRDDLPLPAGIKGHDLNEGSPAEEAPVEESPAEEAPVEESPVEEAPAEESPAEEAKDES